MMRDGHTRFEAGGHFLGLPEGLFLYPFMLNQGWPYELERPDAKLFDGRHFMLFRDVHYYPAWTGVVYSAHPGLISDGGTIRTVVGWGVASTPYRDFLPAYLIHDEICRDARDMNDAALRTFADHLFYPMLLDCNANPFEAKVMRMGVTLYGKWAFRGGQT